MYESSEERLITLLKQVKEQLDEEIDAINYIDIEYNKRIVIQFKAFIGNIASKEIVVKTIEFADKNELIFYIDPAGMVLAPLDG